MIFWCYGYVLLIAPNVGVHFKRKIFIKIVAFLFAKCYNELVKYQPINDNENGIVSDAIISQRT